MVPDHKWIRQCKLELGIATAKAKFKPKPNHGLWAGRFDVAELVASPPSTGRRLQQGPGLPVRVARPEQRCFHHPCLGHIYLHLNVCQLRQRPRLAAQRAPTGRCGHERTHRFASL